MHLYVLHRPQRSCGAAGTVRSLHTAAVDAAALPATRGQASNCMRTMHSSVAGKRHGSTLRRKQVAKAHLSFPASYWPAFFAWQAAATQQAHTVQCSSAFLQAFSLLLLPLPALHLLLLLLAALTTLI